MSGILPCPAEVCYALLCDVPRQPMWLPALAYAIPLRKRPGGKATQPGRPQTVARPRSVAYLLRLVRSSVGLTVPVYERPSELRIRFGRGHRKGDGGLHFSVAAKVVPLDEKSCLLRLTVEVHLGGHGLPPIDRRDFALAPTQVAFEGLRRLAGIKADTTARLVALPQHHR